MGTCALSGGAERWELLTDLQGLEDAAGGMDLKLAGSRAGITAAQLDIKGAGMQDYTLYTLAKAGCT